MNIVTFPENLLTTSGLSILMHGINLFHSQTQHQMIISFTMQGIYSKAK